MIWSGAFKESTKCDFNKAGSVTKIFDHNSTNLFTKIEKQVVSAQRETEVSN